MRYSFIHNQINILFILLLSYYLYHAEMHFNFFFGSGQVSQWASWSRAHTDGRKIHLTYYYHILCVRIEEIGGGAPALCSSIRWLVSNFQFNPQSNFCFFLYWIYSSRCLAVSPYRTCLIWNERGRRLYLRMIYSMDYVAPFIWYFCFIFFVCLLIIRNVAFETVIRYDNPVQFDLFGPNLYCVYYQIFMKCREWAYGTHNTNSVWC